MASRPSDGDAPDAPSALDPHAIPADRWEKVREPQPICLVTSGRGYEFSVDVALLADAPRGPDRGAERVVVVLSKAEAFRLYHELRLTLFYASEEIQDYYHAAYRAVLRDVDEALAPLREKKEGA